MNYYKRNLGDFARDTAHLSQGQIGAYDLMLDWYYANERPLPANKDDVYRIARGFSKEEKKATDKVLADFFTETPEGWVQKRADEELSRYAKQRDTNRETGKKGGRPKKETESEPNRNRIGFISETETEPNDNPNPESSNTEEKAKAKTPSAPAGADFKSELFARWKSLPDGGGGAFLNKLFRDHKPEQRVVEAVELTLDDTRADPKAFVLGVLNQRAAADTREAELWRTVQ